MSDKKIKPYIILKLNQCPNCLGKLKLIEEETYIGSLNEGGLLMSGDSLVEAKLYCPKCGNEYNADKKGARYYIAGDLPPIRPVKKKEFNPFYDL